MVAKRSTKTSEASTGVKKVQVKKAKTISSLQKPAGKARKGTLLLDIGKDLLPATLVGRPSERNKSPWVADVRLSNGRLALAHCPSLDMGGLCVAGSKVLLKKATDSKGKPIGANAVGAYGTPKCEFIMQLVYVDEPECKQFGKVWCCAHPSLGEKLANAIIEKGMITEFASPVVDLRREVTGVAGTNMRADFVAEHKDSSKTVVEVKTVLNTDYNPATAPSRSECVYLGKTKPYQRAAIFPWGRVAQVGPMGEKVVSARAIKHIDEHAAIAKGTRKSKDKLRSMVVFVVVRHDVKFMRANPESCPSFVKHAYDASQAGVKFVAHRIRWGTGKDVGRAFWDGPLKVSIPKTSDISAVRNAVKKRALK